jgi:hypothetical protein
MDWMRQAIGYRLTAPSEQATVDRRLEAQQLRLNALDAAIQAQNAATPYRGRERRRVRR